MHSPTPRPFLVQLLVLLAVLGVFWQLRQAGLLTRPAVPTAGVVTPVSDADIARMRPREEPHDSFTGSTACVKCHRHQHSTWSNSWHRTMTQVTTLTNFMGSLDELVVSENIRYRFYEKDGLPWFHVENPPDHFNPTPGDRHDYPIVMSTGSHLREVAEWVESRHPS